MSAELSTPKVLDLPTLISSRFDKLSSWLAPHAITVTVRATHINYVQGLVDSQS